MSYTLILHVEGPATLGDLTVTGFGTARTAAAIGEDFAQALRARYGDVTVTAEVDLSDRRHVIDLRESNWTLSHPFACRPRLFDCPVTQAAERDLTGPRPELGRFACELDSQGHLVIGEAVA
ncbi:hypothetical protein [Nocardiopsis synnemataformans]|uniref:hypothetical protein n=1 Tax=Nocardiopsis synnemataformans TaxID=61305 RepID=UPI003EC0FE5B